MSHDNNPVSVLMVSSSGYGYHYLSVLLDQVPPTRAHVCGVIDPLPENSGHYPRLTAAGVPIFSDIESFYEAGHRADLVVISSPIQFHVPQSCAALRLGADVLCDKPIAGSLEDADRLIQCARDARTWCMIGYQWSYSRAIQALKSDIRNGRFGRPRRLKTLTFWPRDDAYYARNDWAGRIKDACGRPVLDSPANNAMAHYLHNLLYVIGPGTSASAVPSEILAEAYRVNRIENYDTTACRIGTRCGAEILFYGTHATDSVRNPMFQLEFDSAVITYGDPDPEILVRIHGGSTRSYGSPEDDHQFKKLFDAIDAAGTRHVPVCGPETARAQCACVEGIQKSAEITDITAPYARRDEPRKRWFIEGLDRILLDCYRRNALPSEIHVPWAHPGKSVPIC